MTQHGLGRVFSPDERDAGYPMRAALPKDRPPRLYRYWHDLNWFGDQADTPQCVGYSWVHWLENAPITYRAAGPEIDPRICYEEAKKVDEWPGEGYDGTSVRAGAKVLFARGYIKEYRWAQSLVDIVDALLYVGPLVIGVNWYSRMFTPDSSGVIHPKGALVGGHAVLVNGCNLKYGLARIKNSWGTEWGESGRCLIQLEDLERLVFNENGEACLAVEIKKHG